MLALQAHEFWLEPIKFKIKSGEQIAISFLEGENFTGQLWNPSGVETLGLVEKNIVTDLKSKIPQSKTAKLKVTVAIPGTKMLTMKSSAFIIDYDAEKFNEYLTAIGLGDILDWRLNNKLENEGAKITNTVYSKLIFQVDDILDETWREIAGHKLEIIPDHNPTSLKSGDYMGCKILFNGKPSAHTYVKVWGHVGNKIFLQNIYSENDGTIKFPISASGPWLVSVVKLEKPKTSGLAWESSQASLVFNVE